MPTVVELVAGGVLVGSVLVIAVSLATIAYVTYREYSGSNSGRSDEVTHQKLRAYDEIMGAVVALNKVAVEMSDDELRTEADKLLLDKGSKLKEPYSDVSETFQRHYYIVGEEPYDAVNEYLDYLASYHEDGIKIGELLTLAGKVGRAMRRDVDLPSLGEAETDLPTTEETDLHPTVD